MITLPRRTVLAGGLAAAVGATMGQTFALPAAAAPRSIRRFYGVCIHSTFRQSTYGNDDAVFNAVVKSGVRVVRDRLATAPFQQSTQVPLWRRFRDAGIGVHATVSQIGDSTDRATLETALLDVADCLVEVAGYNEPDGPSRNIDVWLRPTVRHQRWLYNLVQSRRRLSHVKVCAPVLRDANDNLAAELQRLYRRINGLYDKANLHVYPKGGPPERYLDRRLALVPPGPVIVSEGGYSTRLGEAPGPAAVTEKEQADYLARYLTHAADRKVRTYFYELLDDHDPSGDEAQSNWGLFRSNYTPKPAVKALRALL